MLIRNQINGLDLLAAGVGYTDKEDSLILKGEVKIVYRSSEKSLRNDRWRSYLQLPHVATKSIPFLTGEHNSKSILISATAILSGRGSRAFVTIRFVVALSTRSRRRAKLSPVVTASRDRVFGRRRFLRGKASKRAKREIIRVRMLASAIDFEYAQPRSCTIPLLACFLAQLQAFGRV